MKHTADVGDEEIPPFLGESHPSEWRPKSFYVCGKNKLDQTDRLTRVKILTQTESVEDGVHINNMTMEKIV